MPAPTDPLRIEVGTTSDVARAELARGRLAAFHYRFDRARSHLDAAIAADPRLALAYIYRGGSARDMAERREYFDSALALRNGVSPGERGLIDAFRAFLLHDDHDHAIEIFRDLSDAFPDDPFPPAHLALRLYHEKEGFDEAVDEFKRALERDPDFAPTHNWLGLALHRAGHGEAEAVLRGSLERFPEDASGHFVIGTFFLARERIADAAHHLARAVDLDPSFEAAREALARAQA